MYSLISNINNNCWKRNDLGKLNRILFTKTITGSINIKIAMKNKVFNT